MSIPLASMLWAESLARLRFLPVAVTLCGRLPVGGAEVEAWEEEAEEAWEEAEEA
jgi:hypothetical protein